MRHYFHENSADDYHTLIGSIRTIDRDDIMRISELLENLNG